MASSGVRIHGLTELQRALTHADREIRLGMRGELKKVAEPVRSDAERLAVERIRRVGARWYRMRVGLTSQVAYVAPRERGVKGRGYDSRRRPKFADRLMNEAMQPALDANRDEITNDIDAFLGRAADQFNRGGAAA